MKNESGKRMSVVSRLDSGLGIAFKLCYLIHLLMAFNAYLAGENIMRVTLIIVTVLGFLMGACRLIALKNYISFPNLWCLILFLASYVLTALVNVRYGLSESAQYFVWMLFQFGLLYTFDWKRDRKKVKREFQVIALALIAILTVYNLISLDMLIRSFFEFHTAADGQSHLIGLASWGRLFGVHADPNYGAVECGVAIIFAVYFIIRSKHMWQKLVLSLTVIIQFLYITFSVSRSGLVSFAAGLAVFLGLYSWQKAKGRKLLTSVLVGFIAVVVIVFASKAAQSGYNVFIQHENEIQRTDPLRATEETRIVVDRKEELNSDVSNRRFDIWKSAIEIFQKSPVVGVGFRNITPFVRENLPETYIINNDYANFDAMHNVFLDVLASQGVVGIVIFLIFLIAAAVFIIKNLKYIHERHWLINAMMFSCCLSIGISSMFLSHILYVNNPTTYLFWACLGYLVYSMKKDKEEYNGQLPETGKSE